ncbi:F-box protein At2g16365-like [Macadamia integrifolia]|nr:F-box protein At2g16365-like [Macadamia integrifolia]
MASLKNKGKTVVADLPDMNQESPASAEGGDMDGRRLNSSRTESLEVEHLLYLPKQPDNSTFSPHRDSHQCLEPDRRWVKSLKLNASNLPHGTKYLKMGNASTSGKANKLFGIVMNPSTSKDMIVKNFGKGKMDNKTMMLSRNAKSPSIGSVEECSDLTYSWVQRWCHNKAVAELVKPGVNLVSEPQSSKSALYECGKKPFPSVGAMALMGKAMNGFRPCEFRRRGSFVVWNN